MSVCGTESSTRSVSELLNKLGLHYSVIEDKRSCKYNGRFFNLIFKNTSEKYCFLKMIYSTKCKCLERKKKLSVEFIEKVENNITNRYGNIKAVDDFNNAVLSRNI